MRENTSTEWVNKEVDSESDVRLYVTLVRFDCAYYPVFRLNKKLLRDYPNLWAYARDLYQTPGFGDTTNFGRSRSIIILIAARQTSMRLCRTDQMNLCGCYHTEERNYLQSRKWGNRE